MACKVEPARIQTLEIGCSSPRKGFTLIEVLVVLIIISIATSLLVINMTTVSSLDKQKTSFTKTFNFLTEESIVTGNIIGWYANEKTDASYFLNENDIPMKNKILGQPSHWEELNAFKKIFKSFDGTIYEFNNKNSLPLLIFYPSGENSGGIISIYFNNNIQEITINYNGKIESKIINY